MDPEHFDSIARTVSEDASRRHLLARLSQGGLAAALAVLAGSSSGIAARNKNERKKRRDKKRRRHERDESPTEGSAVDGRATSYIRKVTRLTSVAPSKRSIYVQATCPEGTRAIGAGFSFAAGPRSLRLRGTLINPPAANFNNGGGGVYLQHTGSETLALSVYATCLRATSGVTYGLGGREVNPGTIGNQAAGCPAGSLRIGGSGLGYSPSASDYTLPILANYPFDDGWAVTVDNRFDWATLSQASAKAACATQAALGPLTRKLVANRGVVVAAGKTLRTFVPCPTGYEIASGGFILPTSGAVLPVTSRPMTVTGNAGFVEGWEVTVLNRNTVSEKFDAMAVCLGLLPLI